MRFNGVCLITHDFPRLVRFYQMLLKQESGVGKKFEILETEGAELSIYDAEEMEARAPGSLDGAGTGSITIEFEVTDPDEEFERLKAEGVPVVKPPTTQPWGRRSVWFRDPDGNVVNLYADVEPSEA